MIPVLLGFATLFAEYLRRLRNPLPWEICCWVLLTLGITARQAVFGPVAVQPTVPEVLQAAPGPQTPNADLSPAHLPVSPSMSFSLTGMAVSGILALALFPFAMRILIRQNPRAGLAHISLPFAVGFFLDMGRAAAAGWFPKLW